MAGVASRFFTSDDGLELHYVDMASPASTHTPVVCLPGLTRSARDFTVLARALADDRACQRRILAFDYRGRGRSDHDADSSHYTLPREWADILRGLAEAGVDRAHFVGTSRGGLHLMAAAAEHRARFVSVVLNDIGPVLEPEGLRRIKGYVGQMRAPKTLDEAIKLLKIGNGDRFDGLSKEEWRLFATTTFGDDESDLRLHYDPGLARTLDGLDLDAPLPDMWAAFDALRGLPLLAIRGANSDLLSAKTFAAMATRWPACESLVVPGQGHAPLLADAPTIARVQTFLARADGDR